MSFWKKLFSLGRKPGQVEGAKRFLPGAGATFVTEDVAMSVSAYHRGVTYIATQIAKLPWEIKDRENNITELPPSQLLSISPNDEMNAFTWRLFMVMNAIHHGNSYSEIQRDGAGRPIAMWPIASRDVDIVRSSNGELFYRVTGDSAGDKGEVYLSSWDVYHLKNFHTKNGLVGQGLVAYAMDTLGIQKSADRMANGIFENGGMPSGVLKHPGKLSDEAYNRLKESWKNQVGGRKSGGVAILEEGLIFEALNLEPEVLQFLESRKFGVLEIARFLGLPPTKLFDQTTATFSNVENANLEVATDTIDAWACNLEMEADVKLLNKRYGGRYTELDLYSVFRGDMKTRAEYFSKMMQTGAITPNQIRQREGQPGYKGGDRYYIAINNFTPADRLDEVIDSQIKAKEQPAPAPAPKQDPNPKQDPQKKALTEAAISYLTK